jgi:hypothetical protein
MFCALVLLLAAAESPAADSLQSWRNRFHGAGLCVGINPRNPNTVVAEGAGGQLSISYDRGVSWQVWSTPGLELIRQIVIHPSDTATVFCASFGPALMRSTDFGASWHVVLDNFGIDGESIACDPLHPDTMYAGNFNDGNIFRSVDRGATWALMGSTGPAGTANLCAIAVRPDSGNIVYAGSGGGRISKSTNFGATWRLVKNGTAPLNVFQETPRIVIPPHAPQSAYAATYGDVDSTLDVWKSSDGGEHWSRTALRATPTWSLECDPSDSNTVYAGSFSDAAAVVYKTTDGGASWSGVSTGLPAGGYMWNMKIHPLDPSVIWLSVTIGPFGAEGLYRLLSTTTIIDGYLVESGSADTVANGSVRLLSSGDLFPVSADARRFRFGYFEGDPTMSPVARAEAYPYKVEETPLTFVAGTTVHQDIALPRLGVHAIGGRVVDSVSLAPVQASVRLFVHRSIGDTVLSSSTDVAGEFAFPGMYVTEPPVNGYTGLEFDVPPPYATTSLGAVTLDTADLFLDVRLRNADVFLVAASDSGAYLGYYQAALQALQITSNTWDVLRRGPAPLGRTKDFAMKSLILYTGDLASALPAHVRDSIAACLAGGGNVFLTGQNIAEYNAASPLFAGLLGVGFAGNTNIAFNQGVANDIFQGFTCFTTGSGANNQASRDSLLALRQDVHRILDYGSNTGKAAALRVDSAGSAGAKAVVMGFGFEAVHTPLKRQDLLRTVMNYFRGISPVEAPPQGPLPEVFSLEQNYPNPFNPSTTIRFTVPQPGRVVLAVYSIEGRAVAILVDRAMEPGAFEVPWSAANAASGVYFCRLQVYGNSSPAPLFSQTRKLLLLR